MLTLSIADKLLGVVLEYLKKGGENLVKDATAQKAIKEAIERAAERFGNEYSDQGLAKALVVSTRFHDLPSVQEAIRQVLQHPFAPAPQVKIENEFATALPNNQKGLAGDAAQAYLEILREELIGVEKLNSTLNLIYSKRIADASERTAVGVEKLVASGGVDVENGDFVSRDKIVQNVQIDIEKLVELLKRNLPEGDSTPQRLQNALNRFRIFHASLHEWKELHNSLNDILVMLGPFHDEIQYLKFRRRKLNVGLLSRLWRPVSMRTDLLLEWAKTIKQIGLPLVVQADGLQGSRWSVEIFVVYASMESVFQSNSVDPLSLIDSAEDFASKIKNHLYLADKQLRETADELYALSQIVLGSRKND